MPAKDKKLSMANLISYTIKNVRPVLSGRELNDLRYDINKRYDAAMVGQ